MKLFLIHCGYYEEISGHKTFESHSNFFVSANDLSEAKSKAKLNPDFKKKRMHIDGIMEILSVDGYEVQLIKKNSSSGDEIISHDFRELA